MVPKDCLLPQNPLPPWWSSETTLWRHMSVMASQLGCMFSRLFDIISKISIVRPLWGKPSVTLESPEKGPVNRSLHVFFVVCLKELLDEQPSFRWLETPWRSCGTVILWRSCGTVMLWYRDGEQIKLIMGRLVLCHVTAIISARTTCQLQSADLDWAKTIIKNIYGHKQWRRHD